MQNFSYPKTAPSFSRESIGNSAMVGVKIYINDAEAIGYCALDRPSTFGIAF